MSRLRGEFDAYKDKLDKWVKYLGLPEHQPSNTEVETILGFTKELLREQSSTELSEDAIILSQYALFLQHKLNECKTFIRWSSQTKNRIFGDDLPKLHKWVQQTELRIERIEYLARRIELVCQNITNLVRARYNEGRS